MATATTGKGKYGTRRSCDAFCISGERLTEQVKKFIVAVYGDDAASDAERYTVNDEWVALRVKDDREWASGETVAMIHSEGVGYLPDDYNCFTLPVLGGFGHETRLIISLMLVEELIAEAILEGDVVDLADHVRVFGDRLEGNYDLWYSRAVDDVKN